MAVSENMKELFRYFNLHRTEVLYLFITILCLSISLFLKSWVFLLCVALLYCVSISVDFICFLKSKAPLSIETPDGYNEPYHPSVVFFENGWHGYHYWMAFTPMPKKAANNPYIDRWECPCVYASNDGIHFEMPGGG